VEALVAETANGCLVLHRAGTIAERQKPRVEELEKTFHALLQSASGELFSLDKDLSWKSRYGKSQWASISAGYVLDQWMRAQKSFPEALARSAGVILFSFSASDVTK
jgi:hypothetical protein